MARNRCFKSDIWWFALISIMRGDVDRGCMKRLGSQAIRAIMSGRENTAWLEILRGGVRLVIEVTGTW